MHETSAFSSLYRFFSRLSPVAVAALASGVLILTALVDAFNGTETWLFVFYLVPIVLCTWFIGLLPGLIVAVAATGCWYVTNTVGADTWANPITPFWNMLMLLGVYGVVCALLSSMKEKHHAHQRVANTDPMTGLANKRFFYERTQLELSRSRRYQRRFSVAYIDCDSLATINDTLGEEIGNQVLRSIGEELQINIRKSDFCARLDDDEFAVVFVEVDENQTRLAVDKLHRRLLEVMAAHRWPITFSIGVVCFARPMEDIRDMINIAGDLMHYVKKSGSEKVAYVHWADSSLDHGALPYRLK